MARFSFLQDHLQNFPFWMMDVSPVDSLDGLPVFTPTFGFGTVAAPSLTVNTKRIKEGNRPYPRHVVKDVSVNALTCTRGAHFLDADFWRWISAAIKGSVEATPIQGPSYRKNLLLIQFFPRGPFNSVLLNSVAGATGVGVLAVGAALSGSSGGTGTFVSETSAFAAGASALAFSGLSALFGGAARLPARAWMLYGCLPTSYTSGSGLDATSSEVTIQSLDITYEMFEEISLTA